MLPVAALLEKARGLLDSDGHPPSQATLEKTRETLEALALERNSPDIRPEQHAAEAAAFSSRVFVGSPATTAPRS